jgi:AcrR family transcriptional regulator
MRKTADDSRRGSRRAKGEGYRTRDAILQAARELFAEAGFEAATVRRIAERVGITSTTLYFHFPDRLAIFYELGEAALGELVERMRGHAAGIADPAGRLRALVGDYLEFGLGHPNEYELLFMTKPLPKNYCAPEADGAGRGASSELEQLFVTAVAAFCAGTAVESDIDNFAHLAWMCGHGMIALAISHPEIEWEPREQRIRMMTDMIVGGLGVQAGRIGGRAGQAPAKLARSGRR